MKSSFPANRRHRKNHALCSLPLLRIIILLLLVSEHWATAQVYSWSTIAGTASPGSADGTNATASFNGPAGVALDSAGSIYVTDRKNDTIRRIVPDGTNWVVSTLAGSVGQAGSRDGTNDFALFDWPTGIAVDDAGHAHVADLNNNTVRQLEPLGTNWVVNTIAGSGAPGGQDGTNGGAQFSSPNGIATDSGGKVYVADGGNKTVRTITQDGTNWVVVTIAGRAGYGGTADGTNGGARFSYPSGVAPDSSGCVYVTDQTVSTIRKLTLAGTNWVVTTIAGQPGHTGTADGTNNDARFNRPGGLTIDSSGKVYIADSWNNAIRKIIPSGTNWVVSTIGGLCGTENTGLMDGIGSAARFNYPNGVAVDSRGNVYVAELNNNTIRRGIPLPVARIPTLSNGMLTLTWSVAVGQMLQFQHATNLSSADWLDWGGQIVASNASVTLVDPEGPKAQRFYRVVVLP